MQPGRLRSALAAMVAANPAGSLALPSDVGDGLANDVRARLNSFAALVTTDGRLEVSDPVIGQTAAGAKVSGTASALGFPSVAVVLEVGPGDAATLAVTNATGEPLRVHDHLSWVSLSLGLQAAENDP